jgi:hypothetical protein
MQRRVLDAPLVSVKVTKVKRLVQHAALGNSMMFLVLLLVNSVATILITVTKEEIQRVSIAQRVGHLRSAVPSAKLVLREHTAMDANLVQLGFTPRTPGNVFVWGAQQVILPKRRANRFVWGATPVCLLHIKKRPCVPCAKQGGLKMEKDPVVHVNHANLGNNPHQKGHPALSHHRTTPYQQCNWFPLRLRPKNWWHLPCHTAGH